MQKVTTDKQLFALVRALGLLIAKTGTGAYSPVEYRVAPKGGDRAQREARAYYTNDRDDAYATAMTMATQQDAAPVAQPDRSAVYTVRLLLEKHKHELSDVTIGQISDAYHVLGVLARKLEERGHAAPRMHVGQGQTLDVHPYQPTGGPKSKCAVCYRHTGIATYADHPVHQER